LSCHRVHREHPPQLCKRVYPVFWEVIVKTLSPDRAVTCRRCTAKASSFRGLPSHISSTQQSLAPLLVVLVNGTCRRVDSFRIDCERRR
jgi:hypothetical protein